MIIKSFRGLLKDGQQQQIPLSTNDGRTGYRIHKFQIMNNVPGTLDYENIVKVYKIEQTAINGVVDFSDQTLLAAAFGSGDATANNYPEDHTIIVDNDIFNQDIFVTNKEVSGNASLQNYYLELEQIDLSLNEQTVATLQNIRDIGV
jgi:hypothetical protein